MLWLLSLRLGCGEVREEMKRSPLKRHKPLARSTMRRKSRRRKTTAEGRAYMLAVKQLPCHVAPWDHERCSGGIEAHHAGPRPGVGLKCDDTETIPFCQVHHTEWHAACGIFLGWSKEDRREWADVAIAQTRSLIAGRVDTATGDVL